MSIVSCWGQAINISSTPATDTPKKWRVLARIARQLQFYLRQNRGLCKTDPVLIIHFEDADTMASIPNRETALTENPRTSSGYG